MKIKTTYLSELDAARIENEQLSTWYRDLQEGYLWQEKVLRAAIKYIERQSGAVHEGALYFMRDDLGDFSINQDGTVNREEMLLPPDPFNAPEKPKAA